MLLRLGLHVLSAFSFSHLAGRRHFGGARATSSLPGPEDARSSLTLNWFPVGAIVNRITVNPYWVFITTKM